MELEARDKEDGHAVVKVATYETRGSRVLARMQCNDITLFMLIILVRGEKIEVVPQFRYLGLADTDDGALGMENSKDVSSAVMQSARCHGCRSLSVWF
jgi:hypothetical protein